MVILLAVDECSLGTKCQVCSIKRSDMGFSIGYHVLFTHHVAFVCVMAFALEASIHLCCLGGELCHWGPHKSDQMHGFLLWAGSTQ